MQIYLNTTGWKHHQVRSVSLYLIIFNRQLDFCVKYINHCSFSASFFCFQYREQSEQCRYRWVRCGPLMEGMQPANAHHTLTLIASTDPGKTETHRQVLTHTHIFIYTQVHIRDFLKHHIILSWWSQRRENVGWSLQQAKVMVTMCIIVHHCIWNGCIKVCVLWLAVCCWLQSDFSAFKIK